MHKSLSKNIVKLIAITNHLWRFDCNQKSQLKYMTLSSVAKLVRLKTRKVKLLVQRYEEEEAKEKQFD